MATADGVSGKAQTAGFAIPARAAAELDAGRRVRVYDNRSWYEHGPDGVTFVVLRRSSRPGTVYDEVRGHGVTEDEAKRDYWNKCGLSEARMMELARRRQHWGPRELRARR